MLDPQHPRLRIGSFLFESVSALGTNLPVLFLATFLVLVPPYSR